MNSNLWTDQQAESGSTDPPTATTADASGGEQSPLAAAIDASSWDREDIELALDVVQTALLAVWLYYTLIHD